jgi:hypothetical protein
MTDGQAVHDVVDLTAALVCIDSVNPSLITGGAGERELAGFVAGWAAASGLTARLLEGWFIESYWRRALRGLRDGMRLCAWPSRPGEALVPLEIGTGRPMRSRARLAGTR